MEEAADRLRQLRLRKGYQTAADASRAFGWNEHTYKSHENGVRGIKLAAARKYAVAYGSTPGYILTGSSEPATPVVNHVSSVNVVGVVSAGVFVEADPLEDGGITVPVVPRKDIPGGAQYALRVAGESVNKKIPDGAYAICAPLEAYPGGAEHGALVHVIRERAGLHEHTIKQLRYSKDGPVLWPISNSPDHQEPVAIGDEDEDTVRICGVVIGSFQPF